jgi:hypothetical protein
MFHIYCTLGSDEANIFTRWTKGWARVTCFVEGMWIMRLQSCIDRIVPKKHREKIHFSCASLWEYINGTMDDSSYRRNFDLDKKNEIHIHSWIEHLEMSNVWLRFVVKWGKYSPVKFANFVYICIILCAGKITIFKPKVVILRYPDILPKDTLPNDTLPKDILPNGHFADGHFAERTFCRTDSLPKGQFAERTTCRK